MKQNRLSDQDLLTQTFIAAQTEKKATLQLLEYLAEVDERRLYTLKSCSTLFEYLVKELKYSEMQSSERVNAVRLMRAVPEVKEKMEVGDLSISTAAQVQRFIVAEKKASGQTFTQEQKSVLIETCSDKSKREVEKTLFSLQSDPTHIQQKEKIRVVSGEMTELKFLISDSTFQKLEEAKNLIGNQSLETLFDQALSALIQSEMKKKGRVEKSTFPGKEETAMIT